MSRSTLSILALSFGLTGCIGNYPTGVPAPYDASLSLPEDIEISGDAVGNQNDGVGALLMMDVLVFSDDSGLPMDNIQVELLSSSDGVYVLPSTAIKLVGGPSELDEGQCDGDGDGAVDADAPDECYWQYDTSSNQYFQFSGDFANVYQPNYMVGPTNEHGTLRAYVYVDSMPVSGEDSYGDAYISVMLGHVTDVFAITASN